MWGEVWGEGNPLGVTMARGKVRLNNGEKENVDGGTEWKRENELAIAKKRSFNFMKR